MSPRIGGLGWALWAAPALVLPLFERGYLLHMATLTGIYALLALAFNLVFGYTGQFSMCQAAFYGIGAYTAAILTVQVGLAPWAALPASALLAMGLGLVIGVPSLRLYTHYFAICTFGFGEIFSLVLENWEELTGGPQGIRGIPPMTGERVVFYYLVLASIAFVLVLVRRLITSRFGRALVAIREDEPLARSMGVDPRRYKIAVFVLAAGISGVAGAYYAHFIRFISPDSFTYHESLLLAVIVLIGGKGTLAGPVVGALFNTLLPEQMHFLKEYRMMLYGLLLVGTIAFLPTGLVGLGQRLAARRRTPA